MLTLPAFFIISLLGIAIMLNHSPYINKILGIVGVFGTVVLTVVPLNSSSSISFLDVDLTVISPNSLGYQINLIVAITFALATWFCFALARSNNYKEIGLGFVISGFFMSLATSQDLMVILILVELSSILLGIMIALSKYTINRRIALSALAINLFSASLFAIGVDSHIALYNSTSLMSCASFSNKFDYFTLAGLLILIGTPPLSFWFVKGMSSASNKSTILLSIFVPKIALVVIIKAFVGAHILMYIGPAVMIYGLIGSLSTVNLRKILAFAMLSQGGFILFLVACSNTQNSSYLATLIFSNSLCEVSFFIIAAICAYKIHSNNILHLRGAFRGNPLLTIIIAVLSVNFLGVIGTAGFIGHDLVFTHIIKPLHNRLAYLFTMFNIITLAFHMGFRLFYTFCIQKPSIQVRQVLKSSHTKLELVLPLLVAALVAIIYCIWGTFTIENIYTPLKLIHSVTWHLSGIIIATTLVYAVCHNIRFLRLIEIIGYSYNTAVIRISNTTLHRLARMKFTPITHIRQLHMVQRFIHGMSRLLARSQGLKYLSIYLFVSIIIICSMLIFS